MCGMNRNQEMPQSLKGSGPCCAKGERNSGREKASGLGHENRHWNLTSAQTIQSTGGERT